MSTDYAQHWLDDPDWEVDPYDEPTRLWVPTLALVLLALLGLSIHVLNIWLSPPPVKFPPPLPPIVVSNSSASLPETYIPLGTVTCMSSGSSMITTQGMERSNGSH